LIAASSRPSAVYRHHLASLAGRTGSEPPEAMTEMPKNADSSDVAKTGKARWLGFLGGKLKG
jgi:hypothetical protein